MKISTSLSIGDRDLPLEGDLEADFSAAHPFVGDTVKISPIAGGELLEYRGKNAEVISVLTRMGQPVGITVKLDGEKYRGSLKDFFLDRKVLEDIQPPSPLSKAVREGLSHWEVQRTYWGERIDGVEALCFELSSNTSNAQIEIGPWGWSFHIPDTMPGRTTTVDCRAIRNGNFWVLTTAVFPRTDIEVLPKPEKNPWKRVFSWAKDISEGMINFGYPWQDSLRNLTLREKVTEVVLQPLIEKTLDRVLDVKEKLLREIEDPGQVWGALSDVRLKPTYVGLTEPPTDRRPYTIMSITPKCCKTREYLEQVVLHECIHVAVGSRGGEPHNKEFQLLAQKLGLSPQHRK